MIMKQPTKQSQEMDKKKIEAIFSELGFNEDKLIHRGSKSYISHGEIEGSKILVKVLPTSEASKIKSYLKELEVEKIISAAISSGQTKDFNHTEVIKTGQNEEYFWVLRKYYAGDSLCDYSKLQDTTLFGYDVIEDKFVDQYETLLPRIVSSLEHLSSVPAQNDIFSNRLSLDLSQDNLKQIAEIAQLDIAKLNNWYESFAKKEISGESLSASWGDMVPANVIIDKDLAVYFSDFEWFSWDNRMFDVAFFWLFLHRYPEWQKKLLSLSLKNEADKLNFRLSLARIVVNCKWHHRFLAHYQKTGENFVWYNYLVKITSDNFFEEL